MKYIRTKDGRILKANTPHLWENEIINQADTLEELCDEFIAFKNKDSYGWLTAKDYLNGYKHEMIDYYNDGYIVYGAIWTDKGLIYVAKLNDKGELELL